MRSQFFTTELNFNAGNKLVSVSTAIICALLFSMANELFYWDLEGVEFFVVCLTSCLVGYVLAEVIPAAAKALPVVVSTCVIGVLVFSLINRELTEREIAEKSQAFFEETNYCEGHALVNEKFLPRCVKLNSNTVRNWCQHVEGNRYTCNVMNSDDVVNQPQWVTDQFRPPVDGE